MIATKFGNLATTVTVEDSEEGMVGDEVDGGDMCIFIGFTPTLHARRSKFKLKKAIKVSKVGKGGAARWLHQSLCYLRRAIAVQ